MDYTINRVSDRSTMYDQAALENMNKQISEVGRDGMLHFIIKTNEEGWTAQCEEITGIITGGANPNPTQDEINVNIRDAVYSVFDIQPVSQVSTLSPEEMCAGMDMTKIRIQSTISI